MLHLSPNTSYKLVGNANFAWIKSCRSKLTSFRRIEKLDGIAFHSSTCCWLLRRWGSENIKSLNLIRLYRIWKVRRQTGHLAGFPFQPACPRQSIPNTDIRVSSNSKPTPPRTKSKFLPKWCTEQLGRLKPKLLCYRKCSSLSRAQ